MGRDEHNKSKGKNRFAQTPKSQLTHSGDVEFAPELSNQNNKEAKAKAREADYQIKQE